MWNGLRKINPEHFQLILIINKENNLSEKVLIQQLQKDAIVIAENEYKITAEGGHLDFNVSSNVDFKVSVEGEWIKQVDSRGLTNKPLYFDIAENTSEDEREGKIVLINDNVQQEIKVVQKGKTSFAISTQSIEVDGNGGTFEFTVTSNIGYKVVSNEDWIKEVKSRASNEYVHTFEVEENPTAQPRSGVIIVCNDEEVCIPVTVTQRGGTPVETGWENKDFYHRSLIIRFTADWCGYCPAMASNIAIAQKELPDKIEALHMHCSGNLTFSNAGPMMDLYKVTSFPSGLMDMRRSIYSPESIGEVLVETEKNYPSQTGIAFYSILENNNLELDLLLYAKIADKYKVTIMLLEDNVVSWQADYNNGEREDYVHSGVVRMALTNILGDDCTTTRSNQVVKKHYSVTIPASYKKENMRVVVYVQRPFGSQSVLTMADFEGYYVDNCASGKLGTNLGLATIEEGNGDSTENLKPGDDIEF